MDALLSYTIDLLPFIQNLTHNEASVAVTDTANWLADAPGKRLNLGVQVGSAVKEGTGAWSVLQTGQRVRREQPASVFGVPYLFFGAPIRNQEGEVLGALTAALPLALEQELGKMADELAAAMSQFGGNFREIAGVAEHTAAAASSLAESTAQMSAALKDTTTVTNSIVKVSDQTRLLGLNALIESAHAGSAGAGFGVVAREIQSLAQRSLKAIQEMTVALSGLTTHNAKVLTETETLQSDSETLSAQVEESLAIVDSLTGMSHNLKALANRSHETAGE